MKTLTYILAFALLSSVLFAEVQEYSFDVTTADQFVKVSSTMDYTNLLPNTNYSDTVTIDWNVPDAALKGIDSDQVTVYVQVSNEGYSTILFSEGGRLYPTTSFILKCAVVDGACAKGSDLSRSFDVLIETPSAGSTKAILKVEASLSPFGQETLPAQVAAKIAALESQAASLSKQGASVIDAEASISAAKTYAARDEYHAAGEYLRSAENILSTKKPSPLPDVATVLSSAEYKVKAAENSNSLSTDSSSNGFASALSYAVPVVLVALVALVCAGVYIMRKKGSRRGGGARGGGKAGLTDRDFVVGDEN
ncbi:Uncharacterised protein [Candidatus Gugararchaeum adminiculabundum]|nr:Uncharacterised protein [Candidatus Gugararchaeum adminiculabundum]